MQFLRPHTEKCTKISALCTSADPAQKVIGTLKLKDAYEVVFFVVQIVNADPRV